MSAHPNRLSLPDPFPPPAAWQGTGGAAAFSACGRYRWWLVRHWRAAASPVLFLGLNPSRADGRQDDPTLRRLIALADHWGHGQLLVLNLFSRVGRDPAQLRHWSQPVGDDNEAWLAAALAWLQSQPKPEDGPPPRLWLGWGRQGGLHDRDRRIRTLLQCWKGEVVCVGVTRDGHPRHPLYTRAHHPPLPFPGLSPPCPGSPAVTPSTCS